MRAALRIDELRGNADATAGLAHRAFEGIANTQLAADLLYVYGLAFVREARIAGDDEEPADAGERGDDLLDHAVGEIFLLGVAAQILEGQHRNRRLIGEGRAGAGPRHCRAGGVDHTISSDRPCDVLERLLAHVLEDKVEFARGILLNTRRDADPARLGQSFEPCCDIDPVAKDVAILDDDVTDIDADAKLDAIVGRHPGVAPGHLALHLDGAAQRIHHTAKFDEQPVAGGFDEAAPALGDFRSRNSWRSALRRLRVPSSSAPISREYPTTSAAKIAARRRVAIINVGPRCR